MFGHNSMGFCHVKVSTSNFTMRRLWHMCAISTLEIVQVHDDDETAENL